MHNKCLIKIVYYVNVEICKAQNFYLCKGFSEYVRRDSLTNTLEAFETLTLIKYVGLLTCVTENVDEILFIILYI